MKPIKLATKTRVVGGSLAGMSDSKQKTSEVRLKDGLATSQD